jgi:hypothetical protein
MGKNQDPGSGINIPDPQHWYQEKDGGRHSVVEPEPDRNRNFSKVGSGTGTITFQKLEPEP